jgi:hypothetical protein
MSFFKSGEQEDKNRSCLGVGTSGSGEDVRKGCRRVNVVEYYELMYVNGKMRPVDTIPGLGKGEQRRTIEGVNSTMINGKNFYKCHSVSPIQQ